MPLERDLLETLEKQAQNRRFYLVKDCLLIGLDCYTIGKPSLGLAEPNLLFPRGVRTPEALATVATTNYFYCEVRTWPKQLPSRVF